VEKVGNYLKEDLAKHGYKSKHESTKCLGWLESRSHGLPTSFHKKNKFTYCKTMIHKNPIKDRWLEPSQGRQKGKAKERPKDE
jgi:hypothetical protein